MGRPLSVNINSGKTSRNIREWTSNTETGLERNTKSRFPYYCSAALAATETLLDLFKGWRAIWTGFNYRLTLGRRQKR